MGSSKKTFSDETTSDHKLLYHVFQGMYIIKYIWPHQLCKKFVKEAIFNIWRNEEYFLVLLINQLFGQGGR